MVNSTRKRAREESSDSTSLCTPSNRSESRELIFSSVVGSSAKRYSMRSDKPTLAATTERYILLSYRIENGKIILIVNSTQRPSTSLSNSQGDHVTAYTVLLQTICNLVDGENMDDAAHVLYRSTRCFISNKDELDEFDMEFKRRMKETTDRFYPRDERKKLTSSLRIMASQRKGIIRIKNTKLKKAVQIMSQLSVERTRDSIKSNDQRIFADLVVTIGEQLLRKYNMEDTAALPKLISSNDPFEGNRVKEAMKDLKLFNKLLELKFKKSRTSTDLEDFKDSCSNIIKHIYPQIKKDPTMDNKFNEFLCSMKLLEPGVTKRLLSNVEQYIDVININNIVLKIVGKLFNDLFDFKINRVRACKYGEKEGYNIVEGKMLFEDLESALYNVLIRHINFMFIAFKSLSSLSLEDKKIIIESFLESVIKPSKTIKDNFQGWGEHKIKIKGKLVNLNVQIIYDLIKGGLFCYQENFVSSHFKNKEENITYGICLQVP